MQMRTSGDCAVLRYVTITLISSLPDTEVLNQAFTMMKNAFYATTSLMYPPDSQSLT